MRWEHNMLKGEWASHYMMGIQKSSFEPRHQQSIMQSAAAGED